MNDIAFAYLPARDADHMRQSVHDPFHGELCLISPKATKRSANGVIRAGGNGLHINIVQCIGTTSVPSHTFQDFHSHAGVRTAITDSANFKSRQSSFGIAASGVTHLNGMTLGVNQQ